jgi:predicted ATPase
MALAMTDIAELKVESKEGRERLANIAHTLRDIQAGFDEELEFLETNAEWEKFTMAFFGETNAGKSTIIESLRILFNEESRRELIDENQGNLNQLSEQLHIHADHVKKALSDIFLKHAEGVADIRQECNELSQILSNEVAERVKIAEDEASGRVRRYLVVTGLLSLVVGSALASAAFVVLGS